MTPRAIIFDVYGTLLEVGAPPPDADLAWRQLFQEMLHRSSQLSLTDFTVRCGEVISRRHQAARNQGIPYPEICWPSVVREVLPELGQLSPSDQEEFVFRQMQTIHSVSFSHDAAHLLRELQETGYLLGIASNAQNYTLRELESGLHANGLKPSLLEPSLCFWSYEHGFSKPDSHVFQILTARLEARGISPAETLMVGDRLDHDIEPAAPFGWQTWWLTPAPGARHGGTWPALADHLALPP